VIKRAEPSLSLKNDTKLGFLESIRGLAACAVVFGHMVGTFYPAAGALTTGVVHSHIIDRLFIGLPLGFLVAGHFSVMVFFVLSGFVLTAKYFQTKNIRDIYNQAAKRYIRLGIPVLASVMLGYILIKAGVMRNAQAGAIIGLKTDGLTVNLFNLTPNLFTALRDGLVGVFSSARTEYNPVLWTMQIEFFGSFVVFGLAPFIRNVRYRVLFYGLFILLLANPYITCFILGMILADLRYTTEFFETHTPAKWYYVLPAIIFIWWCACLRYPDGLAPSSLWFFRVDSLVIYKNMQALGAVALLLVVLTLPKLQKVLNNKFLVKLGGLSFAIYLTHFLILYSIGCWIFIRLNPSVPYHVASLIAMAATASVTAGVSWLWKRYVDDASIKLSRSFANAVLSPGAAIGTKK
jgi:peptidoglycan/LPS O-acetylase OafA/YrhL